MVGKFGLLLLFFGFSCVSFSLNICQDPWTEFSSKPYQFGAFPETHVSYFRFAFRVPRNQKIRLRIRGNIPSGRYMTFNLYDQYTRTSLGSIPDKELTTDETNKSYTVWLTPTLVSSLPNQIILARDTDDIYEFWYRIYLPQVNQMGGVPLPAIEAFDHETGQPTSCPEALQPKAATQASLAEFTRLPPKPTARGDIFFYASRGMGFYNNHDNQYLVSRLDFSKNKTFALFRFRAPTFGRELPGSPSPEVRYFSFCMGSARTTQTSGCLSDQDFHSTNRETFLLVGPEQQDGIDIKGLCKKLGINFLSRGKNFIPILIYRNVLPREDFAGRINSTFLWPPENETIPREEAALLYSQDKFIGNYSPIGKQLELFEVLQWMEFHLSESY